MRIGHGFDVHAFGGVGPIIIGGVRIPYEKGLLAHSDGDVALHALTDALLGAAAVCLDGLHNAESCGERLTSRASIEPAAQAPTY